MAIPYQRHTFIGDSLGTGGINLKWAATNLKDNESPYCNNITLDTRGSISTRKGYSKLNYTQVATAPICTGIFNMRESGGTQYVLSCFDDEIFTGTTTLVSILSGQTAGNYYDFTAMNDYSIIVNGADDNIKYDGTTVTNLGIAAPAAAATFNANTDGSMAAGTYYYTYTYVDADGFESNPAPASAAMTALAHPNDGIIINITASADTQVAARNIYRTYNGGAIYYYVGQVNDNVTLTFTDTLNDTGLGAEVQFDNDVPPKFIYVETWKNRLIGVDASNRSTIWISKEYSPGQVPALNFIDISPDDGDMITGLASFFDQLIIFKRNSIYVLSGNDELDFAVQKAQSDSRIGAVSNRSIAVIDNAVLFLSERGVYAFDGLRTTYLSELIEPVFDRSYSQTSRIFNWNYEGITCAVNYKNGSRNWYVLAIPTGSSTFNNAVYVFDYIKGIWFPFTGLNIDSMAICMENNEPRIYSGRRGFLYKQDDTHCDGYVHDPNYSTSDTNGVNTLEDISQAEVYSIATAGGATTLTDNTQTWAVNEHAGKQLYITAGLGATQVRTIVSNTADTLTVAAWGVIPNNTSEYTIGGWIVNGLIDVPVKIIDGVGHGQTRIITANTSIGFTVGVNWDTIPTTLSLYSVGYIESEWLSKWFNYNAPEFYKRLRYLTVNFDRISDYRPIIGLKYDFYEGGVVSTLSTLQLIPSDSLWDSALWDIGTWDDVSRIIDRLDNESNRIHRYVQISLYKDAGNNPFSINSMDLTYQVKGLRR